MTGLLARPEAAGAPAEQVLIRPARAGDREAVRAFLAGLSLDSAYRRFFTGIGSPSSTLVRRLVDAEPGRRETVLGLAGREVVGLADCARLSDGCTVELGVIVADAWQRLGLGPRLSGAVLDGAAARGATVLRVHALAENARVARMLRRRWLDHSPRCEDGTLIWDLPLT